MSEEERLKNIERDVKYYEVTQQIDELKRELSASDYKIIKCYEAKLLNKNYPYNYEEVITEREKIRAKINELQEEYSRILGKRIEYEGGKNGQ